MLVPVLHGFWLIKVFKIERLRIVFFCLFVSHGSTLEVFGLTLRQRDVTVRLE